MPPKPIIDAIIVGGRVEPLMEWSPKEHAAKPEHFEAVQVAVVVYEQRGLPVCWSRRWSSASIASACSGISGIARNEWSPLSRPR